MKIETQHSQRSEGGCLVILLMVGEKQELRHETPLYTSRSEKKKKNQGQS